MIDACALSALRDSQGFKQFFAVLGSITILLTSTQPTFAADAFVVSIARKYSNPECTSGYLLVNDKVICYALEKPPLGNMPFISSIPKGTYQGHLRYDHSDAWRIELDGVPGRTKIQIHIGNVPADTVGCIVVGDRMDSSDVCKLIDSATAYNKLKAAFYGSETPNATPNKEITVKIVDND